MHVIPNTRVQKADVGIVFIVRRTFFVYRYRLGNRVYDGGQGRRNDCTAVI